MTLADHFDLFLACCVEAHQLSLASSFLRLPTWQEIATDPSLARDIFLELLTPSSPVCHRTRSSSLPLPPSPEHVLMEMAHSVSPEENIEEVDSPVPRPSDAKKIKFTKRKGPSPFQKTTPLSSSSFSTMLHVSERPLSFSFPAPPTRVDPLNEPNMDDLREKKMNKMGELVSTVETVALTADCMPKEKPLTTVAQLSFSAYARDNNFSALQHSSTFGVFVRQGSVQDVVAKYLYGGLLFTWKEEAKSRNAGYLPLWKERNFLEYSTNRMYQLCVFYETLQTLTLVGRMKMLHSGLSYESLYQATRQPRTLQQLQQIG